MAEAEKASEPESAQLVVRGGRGGNVPPVASRIKPGQVLNPNGRRGNRPVIPIVSARDLAVPHVQKAVATLVDLLSLRGKQAGVARAAARDLIDIACPDLTEETVAKLVTEKLQELVAEAEAERARRAQTEGREP